MRFTKRTIWALTAAGLLSLQLPTLAQTGPGPAATHLPAAALIQACAPSVVFEDPGIPLRVTGVQDVMKRQVYAPGDLVTINAGTQNGIRVGQEFFVRRVEMTRGAIPTRETPGTVRTAGWIRVYAVDDEMSLATIVYACDALALNDYLEPFTLPDVPTPSTERLKPERGNYGRVIVGNDRRFSFGKGDHLVVDRGSDHGVKPGAQFVIYRDKRTTGEFLVETAEAVAVEVRAETSTLLVTLSRDAIEVNDYVAIRNQPRTSP